LLNLLIFVHYLCNIFLFKNVGKFTKMFNKGKKVTRIKERKTFLQL